MKHFTLYIIAFSLFANCSFHDQKTSINLPQSENHRILDSIITVAKTQSLYREHVIWTDLEASVFSKFVDSDTITDLIEPVQLLLHELGDYHGFMFLNGQRFSGNVSRDRAVSYDYQGEEYIQRMSAIYQKTLNQTDINGFILENSNIAYIEIPMMMPNGGNASEVIKNTERIRAKVCSLKKEKPTNWIIDLRGNLGGSMYPMLMGIASLLPNEVSLGGDSYDGKSIDNQWNMKDGVFFYGDDYYTGIPTLKCFKDSSRTRIAVLTGRYTASSGEIMACALLGQQNVKLFGEQTSGATTSNRWIPIGNDLVFNPAISYYASVDGIVHKDGISPDKEIDENFDFENPISGQVFEAALNWLNSPYSD